MITKIGLYTKYKSPRCIDGCMVEYYRSALALASFELNHTAPMISQDTPETNEPVQEDELQIKAETKRKVIDSKIDETGSFHGQGYGIVYITASALAEALDVSKETARQRLTYFKKQGVLELAIEGRPNYYKMRPEFTSVNDDNIKSESEVITVTKRLLNAAEEE